MGPGGVLWDAGQVPASVSPPVNTVTLTCVPLGSSEGKDLGGRRFELFLRKWERTSLGAGPHGPLPPYS